MARPGRRISDNGDAPQTRCIRCGTCCMKGGPALHRADLLLFTRGVLESAHVYTIREGEAVRNIDDTLIILGHEIIKIKGQAKGWTCLFYDDDRKGCKVYEQRPVECRALKCRDLRGFRRAMAAPKLQRRDVIDPNDGILKFISAHEQRCSYRALRSAEKGLRGPDPEAAAEKILDILRYDHNIRPLLAEKLNVSPHAMDFLFGRPLTETIRTFGLCVRQEGDSFLLAPIASAGPRP